MSHSRRRFLELTSRLLAGGLAAPVLCGCADKDVEPKDPKQFTAAQALEQLREGNERFVTAKPRYPNHSADRRKAVAKAQQPFAVVLGCADSRVAPELVFDRGLGDLFVLREVGQVTGDQTLAGLEYAVGQLHVPLVVVLGHQRCGAVKAAVDAVVNKAEAEGHLKSVVAAIRPAVEKVKDKGGDLLELAVRANVERVVGEVKESRPILAGEVKKGNMRVVGAYYDLDTGKVEFLKSA